METKTDDLTSPLVNQILRLMADLVPLVLAGDNRHRFQKAAQLASQADRFSKIFSTRVASHHGASVCGDDMLGDDLLDNIGLRPAYRAVNPQVDMIRQAMDLAGPLLNLAQERIAADTRAAKNRELTSILEIKNPSDLMLSRVESLKKEIENDYSNLVPAKLLRGHQTDQQDGEVGHGRVGTLDAAGEFSLTEDSGDGPEEEMVG